ncbi:MAG TPA: YiiD C-terminal domain-containing protein [Steroidobacteraceae bacterium]|nr:YiiD C-terminal domain-containing protein [Steroidobacteraceae bacterium]
MPLRELEAYLHEHMPLSLAMQVAVEEVSAQQVVLGAPLLPNVNHQDTVFGGSASALAILAAWSLLHTKLTAAGYKTRLVIQRSAMNYEKAMPGYFTARALAPSPQAWVAFTRMLERKGRARTGVTATLWCEGHECGHFEGDFVALGKAHP